MSESGDNKTLYDLLGVSKDADQATIKKAYMKLALKLHPDKNPGDTSAHEKFQALNRVYRVLGDPERRKAYDETGVEDDDDLTGDGFDGLYKYYRAMFREVTEEEIASFAKQYRGSEEERGDLLRYYEEFDGDMDRVFIFLMLSRPEVDAHRFMDTIEEAIKKGEASAHSCFKKWAKKTRKTPRVEDPLGDEADERERGGRGAERSLAALAGAIRARKTERTKALDTLCDNLLAKYGGGGTGKAGGKGSKGRGGRGRKRGAEGEPSEEEFQRARARLDAKAAARRRQ